MNHIQSILKTVLTLFLAAIITIGCLETEDPVLINTNYYLGIESGIDPAVDVLSAAKSLDSGKISPVNNGFQQPAWMSFVQGKDEIFVFGYTSAPEFISYELLNGQLTKGGSFFTDLGIYAVDVVDENTMVLVGSARSGFAKKKIYKVNTTTMTIEKTVEDDFGNSKADSLLSFPVDAKVRGDKMFVAYYEVHADGKFATPESSEAKVAVFSYPELKFEKIISDDRAPNIGRYYTFNALEIDENGDIYTFSPSSLACGYFPVPPKANSGILRIKNGETEFDPSYHIDFETLTGGYKINDLFYVKGGKAVVRVLKEDESDLEKFKWASYSPVAEQPLLETGIIDLYNKKFTLLPNVPKIGGGWASAVLVKDSKAYLGVSSKSYADIYVIDTENNTAKKGAKIEGNYAKAILSIEEKK